MRFIFITNSPSLAAYVTSHNVDRVMVDLETLGKQERQGHLNTLISRHSLADVVAVREVVPKGRLIVRVNPLNDDSYGEIAEAIKAGADHIMLPMFRSADEVSRFAELLSGRAGLILLAETRGAMEALAECAAVDGVTEVHIGLNDLSLDLNLPFLFQPLANGLVDTMAAAVRASGKPLGIGGVARVEEGLLPAQMLLGEHVRLGSTGAILSRTFHRNTMTVAEIEQEMDFPKEIAKLRQAYRLHQNATPGQIEANRKSVAERISAIASKIDKP